MPTLVIGKSGEFWLNSRLICANCVSNKKVLHLEMRKVGRCLDVAGDFIESVDFFCLKLGDRVRSPARLQKKKKKGFTLRRGAKSALEFGRFLLEIERKVGTGMLIIISINCGIAKLLTCAK